MPWLRLLALLPISLLLGHEAVFGVQSGLGEAFGRAMTVGGHDSYWSAFSVVVMALTAGLLVREGLRSARLRGRLRGTAPRPSHRAARAALEGARPWRSEFKGLWPVLFALSAVAFCTLENLEHIAAGLAPHLLGSLIGTEHPFAVPVLVIVSAAVAGLGALIRWRVRILEVRVASAARDFTPPRRHRASTPAREWPAIGTVRAHAWFLVRQRAGRAPPLVA